MIAARTWLLIAAASSVRMVMPSTPPTRQATGRLSAVSAACGPLRRWKLPETTVVEKTIADSRSYDVLVTQARIDAIIAAAEAFCRLNAGTYPATYEELTHAPPEIDDKMPRCRLDPNDLTDAWGQPIFYSAEGGRLMVRSAGADGLFTTPDDVREPASNDPHIEEFDLKTECQEP